MSSNFLSDLARQVGRKNEIENESGVDDEYMDIMEFIESPYGLKFSREVSGTGLFPVQKFILKMFYNLPLEAEGKVIQIPKSWRHAQDTGGQYYFTEQEYLEFLYNEGRCNIKEQDHERRELILVCGRRAGKSTLSAMIGTYETYKLLRKYNPQKYYGMPEGTPIQICSVATTRDQATILYKEVRRHFNNCDFFSPFMDSETQSQALFHTPQDLDEDQKASIRITFYSAVAKGIRGSANIVGILDEVAFFNNTGQASAHEVYQALSPSLAQFSQKDPKDASKPIGSSEGRLIMISSPWAKEGLFYEQREMALSGGPGSTDLLLIQAPTWEVNPTIPFSYFEKEYEKNPLVFGTEFGAEFTDKVKTWIERDADLLCCVNPDHKPLLKGRPLEPHYLGLDLAVKGDRTVATLTRVVDGKIQLVYHEQWQAKTRWEDINPHLERPMVPYAETLHDVDTLDFEEIADWIKEITKRYYVVDGAFDSFEGLGFEQLLDKRGINQVRMYNYHTTDSSEHFQTFKNLMYLEAIELYNYVIERNEDVQTEAVAPYLQEILDLEGTARGKKVIVVEAPKIKGKHDDFADSLVRSVWLASDKMMKRKSVSTSSLNPNQQGYDGVGSPNGTVARNLKEYQRKRSGRNNYLNKRNPKRR
jgi:hypothetical protein